MSYDDYQRLRIAVADGICRATIDNPPINLLDLALILELGRFAAEGRRRRRRHRGHRRFGRPGVLRRPRRRHADPAAARPMTPHCTRNLSPFSRHGRSLPHHAEGDDRADRGDRPRWWQRARPRLRHAIRRPRKSPAVASRRSAIGITPGGGATQRLPRLVGRGRALEIILGCQDIDAATAEAWGYVNRALPQDELRPFVDALAERIASYPSDVVAAAKRAVDTAVGDPSSGLRVEDQLFRGTLAGPGAQRMQTFMDNGGQTREVELGDLPL